MVNQEKLTFANVARKLLITSKLGRAEFTSGRLGTRSTNEDLIDFLIDAGEFGAQFGIIALS
jgi:hypothetical protein